MKSEYDFSSAKRGPIAQSKGKTRITIMLDDAVLEAARARADEEGIGYQTLINSLLKESLIQSTEKTPGPSLHEVAEMIQKLSNRQVEIEQTLADSLDNFANALVRVPRVRIPKTINPTQLPAAAKNPTTGEVRALKRKAGTDKRTSTK